MSIIYIYYILLYVTLFLLKRSFRPSNQITNIFTINGLWLLLCCICTQYAYLGNVYNVGRMGPRYKGLRVSGVHTLVTHILGGLSLVPTAIIECLKLFQVLCPAYQTKLPCT